MSILGLCFHFVLADSTDSTVSTVSTISTGPTETTTIVSPSTGNIYD